MFESVTVDEAITRGKRMVNYPVTGISMLTIGLSYYIGTHFIYPPWTIGLAVFAVFILPWLYWSFMITKWRLWAFDNVRNVHELKKKAIEEKLMWKDGSVWEKTEIRSQAEKEKWNSLQTKFDLPDVFADDLEAPEEILIYYSKSKLNIQIAVAMGLLLVGIVVFVMYTFAACVFFIAIGGFLTYDAHKKISNTEPQIIIDTEGIQTISTQFYPWKDITNEEVVILHEDRNDITYLCIITWSLELKKCKLQITT